MKTPEEERIVAEGIMVSVLNNSLYLTNHNFYGNILVWGDYRDLHFRVSHIMW